jgi:hypothetical protein
MKTYLNKITLSKNSRGCYILDTVKGCKHNCYNDCYAKNIAGRYGMEFSKPVNREFEKDTRQLCLFGFTDTKHEYKIIKAIEKIDMPFVRIGEMGDPSENWEHTIGVCRIISQAKKPIVIITKHWHEIPDKLLEQIQKLNITINTSVSALDSFYETDYRLYQYHRLKSFCNSVLRVVSCDFNKDNPEGHIRAAIQKELFKNDKVIDTVFRSTAKNPLVVNGVINTKKVKFLRSSVIASVFNDKTYFGGCKACPEQCGISS